MPLLLQADVAHIVNTSSVNGFWASLGPNTPHSAYSSAKFAVKGFSEALITDLQVNAPHVHVSVVMPGHIGTSIVINSGKILGFDPKEMTEDQLTEVHTTNYLLFEKTILYWKAYGQCVQQAGSQVFC